MGFLSPATLVIIGVLVLLYGVLVGGTWVRRHDQKKWDFISTVVFIVIAAVATIDLVIIGARQANNLQKAREKLDCVAIQLDAVRVQAPMPDCDVHW